MADRFTSQGYSLKKQTRWSNDKTIIELGYRKISWFVSVLQINHLPHPLASANNLSARHRQITIFCSTLSNNIVNYCQHIKSSSSNHHYYYCVAILMLLLLIIIIIANTWSHCQAIIIIIIPLFLVINIIIIIYLFFPSGFSWTTQFHPYTCTAQLP